MWIFIAFPLTLVLLVLVNCYLQRDVILNHETLQARFTAFLPSKPLYISFLIFIFIAGIVSFGAQYYYFSSYIKAAKITVLILLLAPVAYIDFKQKIIPDKVLLAGLFCRIIFYLIEMFFEKGEVLDILVSDLKGVLLGGGVFLLGALISKDSIGMGDVKLYSVIGIFCSYSGTLASIIMSLLMCFIASVILLILKKKDRKDTLPLAPFVFVGTLLAISLGSC